MRLRNKILLTIGTIILIILIIMNLKTYAIMNLKTYAPYYAMHMPKPEGAHPEVYFALLNLDDIHKPESDNFVYENQDFSFYQKKIIISSGGEWQGGLHIVNGNLHECIAAKIPTKSSYLLYLNRNLYVSRVVDTDTWEKIELPDTEKEEIRQDLLKILQPIFDKQKKPVVNLQWLFNWMYGDFVNG